MDKGFRSVDRLCDYCRVGEMRIFVADIYT